MLPLAVARGDLLDNLANNLWSDTGGFSDEDNRLFIEAMQRENKGLAALTGSPANREALSAFKEKRTANFDGL